MSLVITILCGFPAAIAAPYLFRHLRSRTGLVLALFPLYIFIQIIGKLLGSTQNPETFISIPWAPSFGLWLTFQTDGLALLMASVVSGIGALVIWYGGEYLKGDSRLPRFYSLIILFMTSMLGLSVSGNALLLFIFWELTSISSFFLIGFDHHESQSRASAWQALLVTGGGGLVLLAGLVLVYIITGSFEMSIWMEQTTLIKSNTLAVPALVLIVIGAMTKSAQFPFHFWLPNAMKAPTPVSAYLHSATMVKAGVFLLFRMFPVFGGLDLWSILLITVGGLTIIAGSTLAIGQHDLKKLLAYTTVSALGTMVLLIGIGTSLSIKTALVFLMVHAMYKGSLFLTAGGVDHSVGSRDVRVLGNLAGKLPVTMIGALLAGLSMAGLPPLAGFAAKELIYETSLNAPQAVLITSILLIGNAVNVLIAGWISWSIFFGKTETEFSAHHESPGLSWPPLILAITGLLSGIWIYNMGEKLIAPALKSVLQTTYPVKLTLWHGVTPMFMMSVVTLVIGFLMIRFRKVIQPAFERFFHQLEPIGPANLYNRVIKGIISFANFQTAILQNGYLRIYILVIMFTTFVLVVGTMVLRLPSFPIPDWNSPRFYDVILLGIIVTAAIQVTRSTSRLTTIALLGSIGYSIAILFLLYSAPDLAMVQFSIETLVVILFVLALYKLPRFSRLSSTRTRIFHLIVAGIGGMMMTVLMLLVSSHPSSSLLSSFFVENSYIAAKGRNVVNVILVDFRGFDTLGEISVLAIAAIGVYALTRFKRKSAAPPRELTGDEA